ncbi:hypothetical protein GF323_03650 [Candidatus Woesearchaeota archaeon]|nr:hypothetical protein [Candidatus Woesearchaeota archaeon]
MNIDIIRESLDLNAYEANIYVALLARCIASAGQLSAISNVPRSRCYDVLESLEKKGFVFKKIGRPVKYIARHPEEVLETLKKHARLEENRLLSLYDSARETEMFRELRNLYSEGINYIDNEKIAHSISGKQNINLFLKDMFSRASGRITIHTTKKGLKRKLRLLKKSGHKAKAVVHAPSEKRIAQKNIKLNKKNTGLRLVHAGDELMFFTSPEGIASSEESAVWLKGSFAADAVRNFIR